MPSREWGVIAERSDSRSSSGASQFVGGPPTGPPPSQATLPRSSSNSASSQAWAAAPLVSGSRSTSPLPPPVGRSEAHPTTLPYPHRRSTDSAPFPNVLGGALSSLPSATLQPLGQVVPMYTAPFSPGNPRCGQSPLPACAQRPSLAVSPFTKRCPNTSQSITPSLDVVGKGGWSSLLPTDAPRGDLKLAHAPCEKHPSNAACAVPPNPSAPAAQQHQQLHPQAQPAGLPPGRASELIPGRLFFVLVAAPPRDSHRSHYFSVDGAPGFRYEPFFDDFGPLNLAHTKRFMDLVDGKLGDERHRGKKLYFYSLYDAAEHATNAAVLAGAYAVLRLNFTAEQAMEELGNWRHCWVAFRDAAPREEGCEGAPGGAPPLAVGDVVCALAKSRRFFDFARFSLAGYEHHEQLVHGDWNWVVPGRFLAFSGPNGPHTTFTAEQYARLFKTLPVTDVVRLNKKMYPAGVFISAGIRHHDLFFSDGLSPPPHVVDAFMRLTQDPARCFAVHCKAGLGRTGSLIALRLMADYGMTALESIAWCRLCRPGCVIGQQQQYLVDVEARFAAGEKPLPRPQDAVRPRPVALALR
ncbi:putative tyrosine-protein phosphatase cdc-14 [Diplonema papillatum]|nr:putative tyrosine-protein phosphatase cdc-14 [Diplonema papillatum]